MNKPCADRFTHFLKIDSCQCGKPAGYPAGAAWSVCHQQGPRCRQPAVRAGGRPRQLCDQTGGRDSLFSDAQNLYKHISDIFLHSYTYIKLFRLKPTLCGLIITFLDVEHVFNRYFPTRPLFQSSIPRILKLSVRHTAAIFNIHNNYMFVCVFFPGRRSDSPGRLYSYK